MFSQQATYYQQAAAAMPMATSAAGSATVAMPHHFRKEDVFLNIRQEPREALMTTAGKEKARKPVDPPPIIQLTIKEQTDPPRHYLQSPYLFMCASLWEAERDQAYDTATSSLSGSLVSSLHRLKDTDNKDGAFFVFGDISVKVQGNFRLHFSLFDLHKETHEVQYLGSITSEPFKVLLQKDFKGMDESTYLSRAFSDQGVRLRLRKEPRATMGNKRSFAYAMGTPPSNPPIQPNHYGGYDDHVSKRHRIGDQNDYANAFPTSNGFPTSNTFATTSGFPTTNAYATTSGFPTANAYATTSGFPTTNAYVTTGAFPTTNAYATSYPAQTPSLPAPYNMRQSYPNYVAMAGSPYQFRQNISSNDALLQASASMSLSSALTSALTESIIPDPLQTPPQQSQQQHQQHPQQGFSNMYTAYNYS
ncbi:hypothetical protein BU24DRAFT_7915 [Aaosphaeria arxii CBS 175.79]|uniref:Velvet domain-containing protein n=1 Tax=Aaosphaeria arxii CBS 175.79 TaxID=1450172 RepID=A0A6A5Y6U7_9PLEO|nr:uncharacterized protein BU24DRAFT_7915 [Aaosphaeria arxii CBS 175.79]KAF2020747.1 hypothetical protein BU24DRAFT_7915 [Aaosphaeria arxii CBS 175.79]